MLLKDTLVQSTSKKGNKETEPNSIQKKDKKQQRKKTKRVLRNQIHHHYY